MSLPVSSAPTASPTAAPTAAPTSGSIMTVEKPTIVKETDEKKMQRLQHVLKSLKELSSDEKAMIGAALLMMIQQVKNDMEASTQCTHTHNSKSKYIGKQSIYHYRCEVCQETFTVSTGKVYRSDYDIL
jgi:hypothetical protein